MKIPKFRKSLPLLHLTYFTCMYGRPELTAIMLANVLHLQQAFKKEIKINLAVAFSTDADEQCMKDSGIDAVCMRVPNTYLGKKWNAALALAVQHFGESTHYFVKADDDGVLTHEGMRALIAGMRMGLPYIGFGSEMYLAPERSLASYATYPIPHKVMGTLKAFNHTAITAAAMEVKVEFIQRVHIEHFQARQGEQHLVKYQWAEWLIAHGIAIPVENQKGVVLNLWENEWQRNLDWNSDLRLAYHGIRATPLTTSKPALFNIKLPGQNIWEYDQRSIDGQPYGYEEALQLMPADIRVMVIATGSSQAEYSLALQPQAVVLPFGKIK